MSSLSKNLSFLSQNVELTLISSNYKSHSWNKMERMQHLVSHVAKVPYDFIFMQEAFRFKILGFDRDYHTRDLSRQLQELGYYVIMAPKAKFDLLPFYQNSGLMFASKHPIMFHDFISYETTENRATQRGFQRIDVLNESGGKIILINTHLDHADDAEAVRSAQLKQVSLYVESLNLDPKDIVVFAGDLNTQNPVLLPSGKSDFKWTNHNVNFTPTWPSLDKVNNGQMLDFFFSYSTSAVKAETQRMECYFIDSRGRKRPVSDHFGISLSLK